MSVVKDVALQIVVVAVRINYNTTKNKEICNLYDQICIKNMIFKYTDSLSTFMKGMFFFAAVMFRRDFFHTVKTIKSDTYTFLSF